MAHPVFLLPQGKKEEVRGRSVEAWAPVSPREKDDRLEEGKARSPRRKLPLEPAQGLGRQAHDQMRPTLGVGVHQVSISP